MDRNGRLGECDAYQWQWRATRINTIPYLDKLANFLDDDIQLFISAADQKVTRLALDGIWLIKGTVNGVPVAVVWNDFRVKGGSFAKNNSARVAAFINAIMNERLVLILGLNSLGVRFMEGRTVFEPAFRLVPLLIQFSALNPLITVAFGKCLGLGALLFTLGHYRIAVENNSTINLTGPEVFKLFFGEKVDFDNVASTHTQFAMTDMVHEMAPTLKQASRRLKQIVLTMDNTFSLAVIGALNKSVVKTRTNSYQSDPGQARRVQVMLDNVCSHSLELFNGFDSRLRIFIGELDGDRFGIIMNPPRNLNNMFNTRSLALYKEALRLFSQLRLAVVSLLDTPGADPRLDGDNRQIISKLGELTKLIIEYPYPKMGIIIGRCYGGATVLGLPRVFGSNGFYALKGAELGVMHESIVQTLLAGSANLSRQWQQVSASQGADLKDLLNSGAIDGIIDDSEMASTIKACLFKERGQKRNLMVSNS